MSKEIISRLIFLCIITIFILHFVYLQTYSELKIPVLLLILILFFRFYNIYCGINNNDINSELYFELILIIVIICILYRYALIKKYISF
jgi:hypothetical protein